MKKVKFTLNNGFQTVYPEDLAKIMNARGQGKIGAVVSDDTKEQFKSREDILAMSRETLHAYGTEIGADLKPISKTNKEEMLEAIFSRLGYEMPAEDAE